MTSEFEKLLALQQQDADQQAQKKRAQDLQVQASLEAHVSIAELTRKLIEEDPRLKALLDQLDSEDFISMIKMIWAKKEETRKEFNYRGAYTPAEYRDVPFTADQIRIYTLKNLASRNWISNDEPTNGFGLQINGIKGFGIVTFTFEDKFDEYKIRIKYRLNRTVFTRNFDSFDHLYQVVAKNIVNKNADYFAS